MISKKYFTRSIATILSTLTFLTAVSPCIFAKNNPKTAQTKQITKNKPKAAQTKSITKNNPKATQTKQITKNNPKATQTRLISKAGVFLLGAGLVTAGILTTIAIYKNHLCRIKEEIQKAIKNKDYQKVRNLMKNNFGSQDICDLLLYQAACDNNLEMVNFSIEHGADINDKKIMKFLLGIIMNDQKARTTFLHLYGLRNYFQAQNITEKECPICYEKKAANEFQCIFNCRDGQDEMCFGHAMCNECLRTLQEECREDLKNIICPLCRANKVVEIY